MGHASRFSNNRGRVAAAARSSSKGTPQLSRQLSELISGHELEISCSRCQACFAKSLAFLKTQREMRCPVCAVTILLDVSSIQSAVRRVEKSLIALHAQLSSTMGDPEKGDS